jgi:pimeloyl-ACP methyl ester carboxylesterase
MPAFTISADGARVAFETHGSAGPTLVLIHGWSCNRSYWHAQVGPLSAGAQVITLDLAGHGESDTSRKNWTMEAFGADVAAVIQQAAARDVLLVGHSMGADVALEAARLLRGSVRGLVWVDQYSQPSDFMSQAVVDQRVAPFRSDFVHTTGKFVRGLFPSDADPELVERVCADMASAPPQIALACLEATWNHSRLVPGLLSELRLPTIAINAPNPGSEPAFMNRLGAEVLMMPGGGHFPMLERPREFNAYLEEAIALIDRKKPDIRSIPRPPFA